MLILIVKLWMGIENWLFMFMRQKFSKMWLYITRKDGTFALSCYNASNTEVFDLNGTNLVDTGPVCIVMYFRAFGINDKCLDRLDVFFKFSVKLQK